ncbi:MAG TPA: peptidylprolyl isomerase [Candidatus Acidoferrum sp.]|nr:peptidylprolyl isomerase [Candidatus Acidoferrum sp.]
MRNLVVIVAFFAAIPLAAQQPAPPPSPAQQPASPQAQQKPQPKPSLGQPDEAPADTQAKPVRKPAPFKPVAAMDTEGKVVEEIVARVNNEIITRSELDHSVANAEDDAKSECQNRCTPEQMNALVADHKKNALRDLIDQSLLEQRGKDMGLNVEAETVKQLDEIRIQNKLTSMEALEQAVTAQGLNWEDFKGNISNGILTKKVISEEVGSHITIDKDEVQKYYDAHKSEFVRPEQVVLRSIEVNTAGKTPAEAAELKKKAETALKRVKDGEDFGEIAKRYSDGSTAQQGGYLGAYKRGELSPQLEGTVFKMKKNELTDVLETKQGFLIMQVMEHYDEGLQPVDKVENEIMNKLYDERMQPALRDYLKTLREQSYVIVKPGYQDAAGGSNSEIQEVSATPEVTKTKKGRKKYLLFGKRPGDTGD